MAFFIVIACSWLLVALLHILADRRHHDLVSSGLLTVTDPGRSAYLTPPDHWETATSAARPATKPALESAPIPEPEAAPAH